MSDVSRPTMGEESRKILLKFLLLMITIEAYNSARDRSIWLVVLYYFLVVHLGIYSLLMVIINHMTGLTRAAFESLKNCLFEMPTIIPKRGRPCQLDENGKLGLYLFYIGSKMDVKHLCLLFGVTPSSCCRVIKHMLSQKTQKASPCTSSVSFWVITMVITLIPWSITYSLRQASEWGMRSLQGTFPRLKNRLPTDAKKRHDIIYSIILIHNFRTELCLIMNMNNNKMWKHMIEFLDTVEVFDEDY
jgi:hypothetical protein